MKFAAGIEYDGSPFSGWQRQQDRETVQGVLEKAISAVADEPVVTTTAGRTDARVNASGQVVHFETAAVRPEYGWLRGVNTHLPPAVRMLWIQPVDQDFHARYLATRRSYRYIMLNRTVASALHRHAATSVRRPLSLAPMREAAAHLIGEHDFSAYRAAACQSKTPVRTLHTVDLQQVDDWIWFDTEADGFLHHMVRNIAGMLIEVGTGDRSPDWAREVLESRDRSRGGMTAPPEGLYLCRVDYPERFGLPPAQPRPRFW